MTTVVTWLVVVVAAYAFFALFAWMSADAFIFRGCEPSYGDDLPLVRVPAADGTPLAALHLVASGARFTVLYFHGNAEDLGDVREHLEAMCAHGFSVLAYDYRGYGATPGSSSEARTYDDAAALLRHLGERHGVWPENVILYGRSLGSGAAVELACRESVAGLVLHAPFASAFRVVTPLPLLPGDRFRNVAKLPRVRCPVLIMHGTQDETIPCQHGRTLFAAAREPKFHWWVEGAGHNNLVATAPEEYWARLEAFAQSLRRS